MKHDEYRKHALAIIFHVLGVLWVLATIVLTIIAVGEEAEDLSLPLLFLGLFAALILFAIGTIIDLLARNEHNTRELNKKVLHLIRVEHEAADSLKALAQGESKEEEDDFNFGDLPPRE